jgi:hypothetical protein
MFLVMVGSVAYVNWDEVVRENAGGCFGADGCSPQLNGWPIAADPAENPPDAATMGWRGTQPRHHGHSPRPGGMPNEA